MEYMEGMLPALSAGLAPSSDREELGAGSTDKACGLKLYPDITTILGRYNIFRHTYSVM